MIMSATCDGGGTRLSNGSANPIRVNTDFYDLLLWTFKSKYDVRDWPVRSAAEFNLHLNAVALNIASDACRNPLIGGGIQL